MKKFYAGFFTVCVLIFNVLSAAKNEENKIPSLVFGTASGYAPFVSLNAEGTYEGFDIDVAHLLASKLGKNVEIRDLGSMPSLILALKQGKVDAIIWAISITKERRDEFNFIHYHGEREHIMPFLFWKEVPKEINSIDDLEKITGKAISIEAGTSQDSILRNYPKLYLKYVDKISDAVMDVKYKKSLAVAVDPSLVPTLIANEPQLVVKNMPVPSNLQVLGIGIGIAKNNKSLTSEIETAVAELKQEGKIHALEVKWNLVQ